MGQEEKKYRTFPELVMYILVFIIALVLTFTTLTFLYSSNYSDSCMQAAMNTNYFLILMTLLLLVLSVVIVVGRSQRGWGGNREGVLANSKKLFDEVESQVQGNESSNDIKEFKYNTRHLIRNLLQNDEYTIMKIVLENEGITQDSIHFRTGFSHSKISMIMKKLEEKDLIIRERFGKTYRVYPSKWVKKMLT